MPEAQPISATPQVESAGTEPTTEAVVAPVVQGTVAPPESKPETAPEGAPEKYEFKPAEGSTFDEKVIGVFSDVAKELNLSQVNAQKVIDKVQPILAQRQAEQLSAAREQWQNDVKADKEIGGDALDANISVAKKAVDAFATPELKNLLNETGLGNHPDVVRMFFRVGKAISEDRLVVGNASPAKGGTDLATRLYPNHNKGA